jgi:hypothetical protein
VKGITPNLTVGSSAALVRWANWARSTAAGPGRQRGLGEDELELAPVFEEDLLPVDACGDGRRDVAHTSIVAHLQDPAGVLGVLEQARNDSGLEVAQQAGFGRPSGDILLDRVQA